MGCALAIVFKPVLSTFPQRRGYLIGACFRESLIIRLHSEIGQIHLSIEAQCDHLYFLWVTTTQVNCFFLSLHISEEIRIVNISACHYISDEILSRKLRLFLSLHIGEEILEVIAYFCHYMSVINY